MQMFTSQDLRRQASVIQDGAMTEPVIITYHDRPSFVLMTMQEYDHLRGRRGRGGAETQLSESFAQQIEALAEVEEEPTLETVPAHGLHP
jgi:prevent-host-death family protein